MRILIVYTGGTIGMKQNPATGALIPFDFSQIENEVPELQKFGFRLDTISFNPLVDSSNIQPDFWVRLVNIIESNYQLYDGFVILHGTDTMAYSASALSFMLENLSKPVVFTGSQLPIGMLRTDGKENLISAIEIAAATKNNQPLVPEVSIFFENQLLRGNRTTKHNAEHFNAFRSFNYPPLAEAGINIKYNTPAIHYPAKNLNLFAHTKLDTNVGVLKIFPGISESFLDNVLKISGLRSIVIETFGSGNAPTAAWFLTKIEAAIKKGLIVLNVSQCQAGSVEMEKYETGLLLKGIGVISGYDTTFEAAVTKLFFLQGQYSDNKSIIQKLSTSLSGEITI